MANYRQENERGLFTFEPVSWPERIKAAWMVLTRPDKCRMAGHLTEENLRALVNGRKADRPWKFGGEPIFDESKMRPMEEIEQNRSGR